MTEAHNTMCSIIMATYGKSNFTKLALEGLSKLPNTYEVVVVDNASEEETFSVVNEFITNRPEDKAYISYVSCPTNRGFGGGNNKGYKHSSGEYVIFLNNDVRIDDRYEDWPEIMLEEARKGFIIGTQGGLLDDEFNFVTEGCGLPHTNRWYVSGWCVCASRENFDKLVLDHYRDDESGEIKEGKAWGCWNEKFHPGYFEDVDLTWRARDLGIECKEVMVPIHHFGRVTGKSMGLPHLYKKSLRVFKKEWKERKI